MNNKRLTWAWPAALAVALVIAMVACGGGGGGSSTSSSGTGTAVPAGPAQTVNGRVTELSTGLRLSGVTVTGGGQSATTDANGDFTLTNLPSATPTTTLTFDKSGYALGYTSVNATNGADAVVMRLKQQPAGQTYDTGTAATISQVTAAGPYALILSPNSLDTTDPQVTISITPLDPTTEKDALPGSLVAGGLSPSLLLPVTFAEFSLFDSTNHRVNLRSSASAIVELPIPLALRAMYPLGTTIHCYSYSPITGKWEDFVVGEVKLSSVDNTSLVLAASIRHFSWYGAAPVGDKCVDVTVKVVSAVDGRPLGNARVEASPGTTTYTDADGWATVVATPTADYTAYQTGFDIDGSLTGIPGAKYIEFGKIEEDLTGLTPRPCSVTGASGGVSPASARAHALAVGSSKTDPLVIKVGALTNLLYEVKAQMLVLGPGGGIVSASLRGGVPGANGDLTTLADISGGKIYVADSNGARTPLSEIPNSPGSYATSTQGITLVPGNAYTLLIDADGNGSIDGSATAYAVGAPTWVTPTNGSTVTAAGFTASWSDSAAGVAGYAPVYVVQLISTGNQDFASYTGTDLQFVAKSAINSSLDLAPGSYTGNLLAFSGWQAGFLNGVQLPNNVSGANVTGSFGSASIASQITFNVQ